MGKSEIKERFGSSSCPHPSRLFFHFFSVSLARSIWCTISFILSLRDNNGIRERDLIGNLIAFEWVEFLC